MSTTAEEREKWLTVLSDWQALSATTPSDEDGLGPELAEWKARLDTVGEAMRRLIAQVEQLELQRDEAVRLLEWYATAEYLAESFHNLYEVLASKHGWVTRPETQVAWDDLPANNKALMLEVAMEIGARARAFLAKETHKEKS